jgi:hypothetical protein
LARVSEESTARPLAPGRGDPDTDAGRAITSTHEPAGATYSRGMCRNIRQLHNFEPAATSDEVHAAALQYVRKVSGSTKPSQANQAAFDEAVEAIAHATAHLLEHLTTSAPPKDREVERQKARERNAVRFGTPA